MGKLIDGQWHDVWYDTKSSGGRFVRADAGFRNWITPDGSAGPTGDGGFPAAKGRYHLYVSYACPWAHRTLIFRRLKGLEAFGRVALERGCLHDARRVARAVVARVELGLGKGGRRVLVARDLDIGPRAKTTLDHVDPSKDLLKRQVTYGFGVLREIAELAVEIAALGDLQGDAADRQMSTGDLPCMPMSMSLEGTPQRSAMITPRRRRRVNRPARDLLGR